MKHLLLLMLWGALLIFCMIFIAANIYDLMCMADGLFGTVDPRCLP